MVTTANHDPKHQEEIGNFIWGTSGPFEVTCKDCDLASQRYPLTPERLCQLLTQKANQIKDEAARLLTTASNDMSNSSVEYARLSGLSQGLVFAVEAIRDGQRRGVEVEE